MKQEMRHISALILAWAGWVGALILTAARVTDHVPVSAGIVIVLFIGVAIAAGMALSRMRLTATMLDVYRAGVETAKVQKQEREDMERRIIDAHEELKGDA